MTQLRRTRRDHRARAPGRRKRRNLVEFVPRGDSDFALTARNFAQDIQQQPEAFGLTAVDAQTITQIVSAFREALYRAQLWTSSSQTILIKKQCRKKAEQVVRKYGNIIRANPDVSCVKKQMLRIRERPTKLRVRKCPTDPPKLIFVGTGDGVTAQPGRGVGGVHVLKYLDYSTTNIRTAGMVRKGKPDGAARLELFCDLVPAGEPVPKYPGATGHWPLYLRSYSRSPMEVEFPLPAQPMQVVYWARWCNATGEVSRFSKTCVARIEGGEAREGQVGLPSAGGNRVVETTFTVVQMPEFALPAGDDAERLDVQMLVGAEVMDAARLLGEGE